MGYIGVLITDSREIISHGGFLGKDDEAYMVF